MSDYDYSDLIHDGDQCKPFIEIVWIMVLAAAWCFLHRKMRRAFDLVAPNIPAFGRLTGKKLHAGKVSHEPDNAFPRLIRLFGMLFDMAEDDLTHTGVNTLRMSLRSKDTEFGVCPCPIPRCV